MKEPENGVRNIAFTAAGGLTDYTGDNLCVGVERAAGEELINIRLIACTLEQRIAVNEILRNDGYQPIELPIDQSSTADEEEEEGVVSDPPPPGEMNVVLNYADAD